ncbi:MAG: hypothetical protein LLF89_01245 [Spirochaetaceae bacterium]|nr:hypothetical protein [Spirochaetaceae bacterium]
MSKKIVIGLACFLVMMALTCPAAFAQKQLAVELIHPVYRIIETAELRGILTKLSSVKPYTRAQVADMLAIIQAHMDAFSPAEREMIAAFVREFATPYDGEPVWTAKDGMAAVGGRVEADVRADPVGLAEAAAGTGTAAAKDLWQLTSRVTPYIAGAPTSWLSIKGEAGFTYDKIEEGLYLPYEFSKDCDTGHIDFSSSRWTSDPYMDKYDNGKDIVYPMFSYDIREDIAAATDSGSVLVRLSRFRRDWGIGSGSLALSGTARPFVGFETQFRPSEYFAISGLVGSLTNWQKMGDEKSTHMSDVDGDGDLEYDAISWQKMLGLQRLELFPTDWLTVSATSTLVGAKRFELGYMSPLLFAVMYQNQLADVDNLAVQVDGSVQVPNIGKLYGSFYADEMEITNLSELFTKARNMFALQGGAKIPLPGLPFSTLTLQYTKIEPFVYAHYPTWYPDYRLRVDTSYTQDGENLGYYLPPNSDEFLVKFEAMPAPEWRVSAKYSFVRHGDNPEYDVGDSVIFGDITKWLQYTYALLYMDKDFLHDGLYDYNHILKFNVYWRPANAPELFGVKVPLEIGAGYGLSYTWYDDTYYTPKNASTWVTPSASLRNIMELSVKLFL